MNRRKSLVELEIAKKLTLTNINSGTCNTFAPRPQKVLGATTMAESVELPPKEVIVPEAGQFFILRTMNMIGLELVDKEAMKNALRKKLAFELS